MNVIDNKWKGKYDIIDIDGRKWIHTRKEGGWIIYHSMSEFKEYVGCVSKEDNDKYKLGGKEMMGDDTYIVEFTKEEYKNWQRTKLMDEMLNEK